MKRAAREKKRFRVSFEIDGTMIDSDTALSEQSLTDFIEIHFSHRQDCRVRELKAEEVKD